MYYFLSAGTYLVLLWIFGLNEITSSGAVLVPHDTFYPLTDYLFGTVFATFNSALNYGNNLAALMVLTPDALVILALKVFFNNHNSQIIHIGLCLIVFHAASYFSICKIFNNSKLVGLLTLCYCFSPYASVLYSAGIIYQLSTDISLGLLPLLLFRLMQFNPKTDAFSLIPMIALLAFGLLFIYPALLLICLTLLLAMKKYRFSAILDILSTLWTPNKIISIAIMSAPFCIFIYLMLLAGNDKAAFIANGTSTAIKGGIFYPLMQISAWGLYNIWEPRAILSFYNYFFENPYKLLSILLPVLFITFLSKNKKVIPIIFIIFLAFFSKGPNPPLGEVFTLIINNFPFGYMIRSPDSKFGAFIAAWFIVAIFYLRPKQKIFIVSISLVFLATNLSGMFYHGAISSSKGDPNTTSFIRDPEAAKISKLITGKENTVVITDTPICSEEFYDDKFHTCHGLLVTNINRQLVQAPGKELVTAIEKYEAFPMLVLINRRQKKLAVDLHPMQMTENFKSIYSTVNYELFFRPSINKSCTQQYDFSCVHKNGGVWVSIPESAFKYYYPDFVYDATREIISLNAEPKATDDPKRTLFLWAYSLAYLLCLAITLASWKACRKQPNKKC